MGNNYFLSLDISSTYRLPKFPNYSQGYCLSHRSNLLPPLPQLVCQTTSCREGEGKKNNHTMDSIPESKTPSETWELMGYRFVVTTLIQIDCNQNERIHEFTLKFSSDSLQSSCASFFPSYRKCPFQTTKLYPSPCPLKRSLSTAPRLVLQGLTERVPSFYDCPHSMR